MEEIADQPNQPPPKRNAVFRGVDQLYQGVPFNSYDSLLLFVQYSSDSEVYNVTLGGEQAPMLIIDNTEVILADKMQEFREMEPEEALPGLIERLQWFETRVANLVGDLIITQDVLTEFEDIFENLAAILGINKYFFEGEPCYSKKWEAKFVGPALAIITILGHTQISTRLRRRHNLMGSIDHYLSRLEGQAPFLGEMSHITDSIVQNVASLNWNSSTSEFYSFNNTDFPELGLPPDQYILKVFDFTVHNGAKRHRVFSNEGCMLLSMRYPQIVRLFGYTLTAVRGCLIIPHYPRMLEACFNELSWHQSIRVCLDLAYGIHLIQTSCDGLYSIHSDIKTQNVCLDASNNAYIIDLGGQVEMGGDRETYSEFYYDDHTIADRQSDVYSFGITMLRILTGEEIWLDNIPIQQRVRTRIVNGYQTGQPLAFLRHGLQGQTTPDIALEVVRLALNCANYERREERGEAYAIADTLHQICFP